MAASLQLRNAHVYLAAAVWAGWAQATDRAAATYLNDGPLIDSCGPPGSAGGDGLHWDHDLLPNDILYNREVLAVLDRNGGRITHLFAVDHRRGGRAVCVSGTPKAYQWTGPVPGRPARDWLTCDGGVLENTVLTPNHLYVASDLARPARSSGGATRTGPANPRRGTGSTRTPSTSTWPSPTPLRRRSATPTGRRSARRGPRLLDDEAFVAACAADRAGKAEPRPGAATGVVWHEGPAFTKTIRLSGSRLDIRYERRPAGPPGRPTSSASTCTRR